MFLYAAIRFSKVRKKLYVIAFAREYSDELLEVRFTSALSLSRQFEALVHLRAACGRAMTSNCVLKPGVQAVQRWLPFSISVPGARRRSLRTSRT